MAKLRHKTFDIYEFRDEAIEALTSKSKVQNPAEAPEPETCPMKHLQLSTSADVTLVEFIGPTAVDEKTSSDLKADFSQLADKLRGDSRVLLDFSAAESFTPAAIDSLMYFNQRLRIKGSRMALCCLEPVVQQAFF